MRRVQINSAIALAWCGRHPSPASTAPGLAARSCEHAKNNFAPLNCPGNLCGQCRRRRSFCSGPCLPCRPPLARRAGAEHARPVARHGTANLAAAGPKRTWDPSAWRSWDCVDGPGRSRAARYRPQSCAPDADARSRQSPSRASGPACERGTKVTAKARRSDRHTNGLPPMTHPK